MLVETERFVLRDFKGQDAVELFELKYDRQVMEYHPTFIKRNATIDDAREAISFFQSVKDTGNLTEKSVYISY